MEGTIDKSTNSTTFYNLPSKHHYTIFIFHSKYFFYCNTDYYNGTGAQDYHAPLVKRDGSIDQILMVAEWTGDDVEAQLQTTINLNNG